MKITEKMEQEIRTALIEETKIRKMNRWDALNFIGGYTLSNGITISLEDAMQIAGYMFACDLIAK